MRRAAHSVLLLLVMTLPGALSPLAAAQGDPVDALGRAVQDALRGVNQTQQQAQPVLAGPGGLPDVNAAQGLANGQSAEAQAEVNQAASTPPMRTLFYDGFEGASLAARGWSSEALLGDSPWGLADAKTGAVQRLDGSSFIPQGENGKVPIPVKDGRHAATVLNPRGVYDGQVDARLVTPVIDLRSVVGASVATDDPYDLITRDPTLSAPYKAALAFWLSTLAPLGRGVVGIDQGLGAYTYLLTTEPTHIRRISLQAPASSTYQGAIDQAFVNPLESRYGAALINLTFYQKYVLNPKQDAELYEGSPTGDTLDGAFLEARVVHPDGTTGPWEHLDGDAVFEAQVDKGGCPVPGLEGASGVTRFVGESPCPPSNLRVPLSGVAEIGLGALSNNNDYAFGSSYYQGRVKIRAASDCAQLGVSDCRYDVPAFVGSSQRTGLIKSHFTLNRFAGEEIQLAFRLRSREGPAAGDASQVGWFLDAVKVEALVPARDPGITSVDKPRPFDTVPVTQRVQPVATVTNNGFLPVDGVQVNFTIEERPPDVVGDVQRSSSADQNATLQAAGGARVDAGAVDAGSPPGQLPGVHGQPVSTGGALPTATVGAVQRDAGGTAAPRVLLRSSTLLPRLEAGQSVQAVSPVACTACVPGRYQLRVELSLHTLGGGDAATAPERVEDGSLANDNATVPFDVRDVVAAKVRLGVDANQVLTDINEPKTFRVLATNLGNRDITGVVQLNATALDPVTLQPLPGQGGFPVGSLFVGPGALPAGRGLTSYGADHDSFAGNVTWDTRGLPPGVYRVQAALLGEPAPAQPAVDTLNAFIRTTPTAYVQTGFEDPGNLPADGFGADHLERAGFTHRGWFSNATVAALPGAASYLAPLPKGAVTTNHTWEATGDDDALVDLSALGVLHGLESGVAIPGITVPAVPNPTGGTIGPTPVIGNTPIVSLNLTDRGVNVCLSGGLGGTCVPYGGYADLEKLLLTGTLDHHSYLNDYYLSTTLDLTQCRDGCAPELRFWQQANFTWQGSPADTVTLPVSGAGPVPSSVGAPQAVRQVSEDQASENRSRGLVEVTVLDTLPPALQGQGATLHPDADLSGELGLACANAALACSQLAQTCPAGAVPGVPGLPASVPSTPVTPVDRFLGEQTQYTPPCLALDAVARSATSSTLAVFESPLPEFQHAVVRIPDAYKGHRIQLSFHFQTTVGRLQGQTGPHAKCPTDTGIGICLGMSLDRWVLDNIELAGAGNASFLDTAGDPVPGAPVNTNWTRWASYHTMRSLADADVTLDPSCARTVTTQPGVPNVDASCIGPGTQVHGVILSLDGRGWQRVTYRDRPSAEGARAGPDTSVTPTGPENPYPDGWFLDASAGFNAPGRQDFLHRYAMRWGGPRDSVYPSSDLYAVASTPAFDLSRAAQPFVSFQTKYDFDRALTGALGRSGVIDGGAIFLARYVCPAGADCAAQPGQLQFDRRGQVTPDGGYPGSVTRDGSATLGKSGVDWNGPDDRQPNAFVRASGGGIEPQWVKVRADMASAFDALCLKVVDTADGREFVQSYRRHELLPTYPTVKDAQDDAARAAGDTSACPDDRALGAKRDSDPTNDRDWWQVDANTLVFNITGTKYTRVTSFGQDPGARYAVEFHAVNTHPDVFPSEGTGWTIDDFRVGERFLANDVGVSAFVVPGAGKVVGPGEEVVVRVNVTNYGLFTQHGVKVHFNVTQQGVQVFPDPRAGNSVVQAVGGLGVPGLRDPNPVKNVTVSFDTPWVPRDQGVFTINAWTELTGEVVNGVAVPLADEDASNDLFAQNVEVREVHSVRVLRPDEMPDAQVVSPLVGTPDDARAIRLGIVDTGTMSEGLALGGDRALSVHLSITNEAGEEVLSRDLTVDRITAGERAVADFGPRAWQANRSGLYTLRFRVDLPNDSTPDDNERVVRVLVLTQLIPKPGESWTDLFRAAGTGWANGTRLNFDAGQGWSFGSGKQYGPNQDGVLVLKVPQDLTTFRNAVLAVKHSYAFERGYDGGRVEVSPDGANWVPVEPLGGYPANLTTASPVVQDPEQRQDAFTGTSGGVVESFFPLGTVNLTRTDLVTLLHDSFEPGAPTLLGQRVDGAVGQWYEVRTNRTVPAGKAWFTDKAVVFRGPLTRAVFTDSQGHRRGDETGDPLVLDEGTTFEGVKELRMARPFIVPPINGSLLVEYQEWRSLGTALRGDPTPIHEPSGVEADLEVTNDAGATVDQVVVLPKASTALRPYADNQMDWTQRTVVLPAPSLQALRGEPLRLAFKVSLAEGNNRGNVRIAADTGQGASGGGRPGDTDVVSPGLGWAVAAPRVSMLTSAEECDKAIQLAQQRGDPFVPRYADGRCILFEDPGLAPGASAYGSTDQAAQRWEGAWSTRLSFPVGSAGTAEFTRRASWDDGLDVGGAPAQAAAARRAAAQAALRDDGWRIVDRVGLSSDAPVWDTRSVAPPGSGHGVVAMAQGSGVDARLITPLSLRAASGEVRLTMDHSFKFTDLEVVGDVEPFRGGYAGGRVEVSQDGGITWVPVAPSVDAPNPLAYTGNLADQGFIRTFTRGTPTSLLQCHRPFSPGCVDPADPFAAPAGWTPADGRGFTLDPASSTQTPFAGAGRDPEGDSGLGFGSMAFSGTTCVRTSREQPGDDPCTGPEDWERSAFDLTRFAGQDVLLAFHVWLPTHRFVGAPHFGTDGSNAIYVPQDFWRIDNVTVQARVLDGRPLSIRLHGFSDSTGQQYGWDVLNVSLLGDQNLANLGVRILDPQPGQALFGSNATVAAVVQNKGLQPLAATGMLYAQQDGQATLQDGGFEDVRFDQDASVPSGFAGWDLGGSTASPGTVSGGVVAAGWFVDYATPAERGAAFGFRGDGTPSSVLTLQQDLTIPPGAWTLRGRDLLGKNGDTLSGGVELTLLDNATGRTVLGPLTFAETGTWANFTADLTVENRTLHARLVVDTLPGAYFVGAFELDDLRIEPRVPGAAAPDAGGDFEDGAGAWKVANGTWRKVTNPYDIAFAASAGGVTTRKVPSGGAELAVEGTGHGEQVLYRNLTLAPGAYRFSGMFASRNGTLNLTDDQDHAQDAPAAGLTTATTLVQTARATDLPRSIRSVTLYCATASCSGSALVTLKDDDGYVLGRFSGPLGAPAANLSAVTGPLAPFASKGYVSVPYGTRNVRIEVTLSDGTASGNLTTRPDAEYPYGTLRVNASGNLTDTNRDLRIDFLSEVESPGGQAGSDVRTARDANSTLQVGTGVHLFDAANATDTSVDLHRATRNDLALPQTLDPAFRQVVDVSGVPERQLNAVVLVMDLPAVKAVSRPDPAVPGHCTGFLALREGEVRVQVFDAQGKPLGKEGVRAISDRAGTATDSLACDDAASLAGEDLPSSPDVRMAVDLQGVLLPAGARSIQVGVRVLNLTTPSGDAPRLHAVSLPVSPPGEAGPASYLTYRGAPALFDRAGQDTCAVEDLNLSAKPAGHLCVLAMQLNFTRVGLAEARVVGAQGVPAQLPGALGHGGTLGGPACSNGCGHGLNGSLPFAQDFVVPPGSGKVQLQVRLVDFQGEVLLDDLRVQPLSPPAATFAGVGLASGESRNITGPDGEPPAFPTVKGARYRVVAQALPVGADGAPTPEAVVGDDQAVVVSGAALGAGRIVVSKLLADPNSYNLSRLAGVPMDLLVTLHNEGAFDADVQGVTGVVSNLAGAPLFQATQADFDPAPDSLTLRPLEERTFRWAFIPEATTPSGVYNFSVDVTTQGGRVPGDSRSVFLWIGSDQRGDFNAAKGFSWNVSNSSAPDDAALMFPCKDAQQCASSKAASFAHWSSYDEYNVAYPTTNPCRGANQPPECGSPSRPPPDNKKLHDMQWYFRKTSQENLSAWRSFRITQDTAAPECSGGSGSGGPGGGEGSGGECGWPVNAQTGQPYYGTVFVALRSPAIDITYMQRPQLLYADRHQFNAEDAQGSIFARLVHCQPSPADLLGVPCDDARSPVFPAGDCENPLNVHGWQRVDAQIQGASAGFAANKWVMRSVDLGPLLDRAAAESGRDLGYWDHVQLCWHLEQPGRGEGATLIREWAIDDIFVTPYGTALGPAQDIPIGDNVTKDFRIALVNRGAYTDTYQVALQDELGLPSKGPSNWQVQLLDEQGAPLRDVRVQPGERRIVTVRVHVDVAQPNLPREGQVDLAVTAVSRTTAFLRSTQHLVFHFLYPDRPNLRITGVIVNDAALAVDKPRTVDVIVQNTGTVAAVGAQLAVLDKVDASLGVAPVSLKRVDGTDIPPFDLAPGDIRVITVNWVPSIPGEHNITAIADPFNQILEFDETDNVFVKPVDVPKAEFPDLLVEASASRLNPTPGDVVLIQARVTNHGGAPADGVQVTMRAGVSDLLPGDPPHILPDSIPPGGTVSLNVSFRAAFPGQQFIFVRAVPRAGVLERLETIADNTAVLTVSVRSRGLDAAVPQGLVVKPGGTVNATLTVLNRGDVDDGYDLRLIPPDNWRAQFVGYGEELSLGLGNHSQVNLTLQVQAPPFAEAGPVVILLRGASQNTTEVLESGVQVDVPQRFGLRFTLDDALLLQPGATFLPVQLGNQGNGLDVATVRASALPAGWALEPASVPVPARTTLTARLNLSIPTSTPEGAYPVTLEAQGKGGDLLAARSEVQVLPLELLQLEVKGLPGVALPGAQLQGTLVVRNAGNLAAHANLSLLAPPGWRARLDRGIASLQPGEQRALPLVLDVPQNASGGEHHLQAVARSGRGADYALDRVVRAARADLAVEGFDLQPKGALRDGNVATLAVTVKNRGDAAAPGSVAVYLDDALVGFDAGRDLQPGEEATMNVSFKVRQGEHVVLAAVDPGRQVGEYDEDNNALVKVLHVQGGQAFFATPGPEPVLAAAAVAFLALLRRRGAR